MPRYVSGSSTFSNTLKSPIRLKLWKMKPISRLRTRARSDGGRSATGRPFSVYSPLDGVSSRPRIESRVDLPQPDGPAIDTYSPRPIVMSIAASAWVSTSSVRKTLLTPSNLISGSMLPPVREDADTPGFRLWPLGFGFDPEPRTSSPEPLFQPHPLVGIPRRHVGKNHLVARLKARDDFNRVHRTFAELYLDARRFAASRVHLENADRA